MLAIKLARRGKRNQPFFRLIIQEKTKDPFGDFLEDLGYYNPRTKRGEFKAERIKYWLEHGAQATPSANNLLINQGIIKGEKQKVTKKHREKKGEAVETKTKVKTETKVAVKAEAAESKTETPTKTPAEENN